MRTKIILLNLLAVLIVGLGGYFFLCSKFESESESLLRKQVESTNNLFMRSEALHGYELLFDVREQAKTKDVTEAFTLEVEQAEGETTADVEKKTRQAWFRAGIKAVEMYSELWELKKGEDGKPGKKPELVFITDRNGVVIARNTTPNACPAGRNVSVGMPVVARALKGKPSPRDYALWSASDVSLGTGDNACKLINTKLLELAAAPVWVGGEIAGTLVVGFEISNGVAKDKKDALGLDLAVLVGGKTYSSSFTTDSARQSLEEQFTNVHKEKVQKALQSGNPSEVFKLEVEGKQFLAIISPAASADGKDKIANVVLGSLEEAAYYRSGLMLLLVFMGVACLIVIIGGMLLGGHFLKPVMEIEEGLLKVINGEYDYRFDVKSSEVGGLSYRINQLVGVLTGEEEEEEEEE